MIPIDEFTEEQRAALELYLMVEAESEYKPLSYVQISSALQQSRGISVSKSTVGRWAEQLHFKERLDDHINALVLADDAQRKDLQTSASKENIKLTLMSLEENSELLFKSHDLLKKALSGIELKHEKTKIITKDDAKFILSVYNTTSAREDRLHDRQAQLKSAELIGKAELLSRFAATDIDIEEDDTSFQIEDASFFDIEVDE